MRFTICNLDSREHRGRSYAERLERVVPDCLSALEVAAAITQRSRQAPLPLPWTLRVAALRATIARKIEAKLIDNGGWEHFLGLLRTPSRYGSLSYLTSRGIIVGTQVLAVLAFLFQKSPSGEEFALIFVDVLAVALTMRLLMREPLVIKSGPVFEPD